MAFIESTWALFCHQLLFPLDVDSLGCWVVDAATLEVVEALALGAWLRQGADACATVAVAEQANVVNVEQGLVGGSLALRRPVAYGETYFGLLVQSEVEVKLFPGVGC